MDRFGATDAWLMFLLWMAANGHLLGALVALVILALYAFSFGSSKPKKDSAAIPPEGGERKGNDRG